jgi:DNA-binding CsgD family transcriptional regulator
MAHGPEVRAMYPQTMYAVAESLEDLLHELFAAPVLPLPAAREPDGPWWEPLPSSPVARVDRLTSAEVEVMRWLGAGKTNLQIGELRGRSAATVRNQLHSIFIKLGASTRGEAVAIWQEAERQRPSND